MRLSFWNWVHLLSPYFFAILMYRFTGESFLGGLGASLFFVFLFSMIPHMNTEVKTGRSFNSKYGKFDEYRTRHGEVIENAKMYINVLHILTVIALIIFGISKGVHSDFSTSDKKEDSLTTKPSDYNEENNINVYNDENNEIIHTATYNVEQVEETNVNSSSDENSNSTRIKSNYRIYDLSYSINYNEAESECRRRGMRLPNYDEFLEISNSPELMTNLKTNDRSQSYWTSTDYIDGEPFDNKESIQGNDLKNYKKNYNPFTEKTIMTDTRLTKNCTCIEKLDDSNYILR